MLACRLSPEMGLKQPRSFSLAPHRSMWFFSHQNLSQFNSYVNNTGSLHLKLVNKMLDSYGVLRYARENLLKSMMQKEVYVLPGTKEEFQIACFLQSIYYSIYFYSGRSSQKHLALGPKACVIEIWLHILVWHLWVREPTNPRTPCV